MSTCSKYGCKTMHDHKYNFMNVFMCIEMQCWKQIDLKDGTEIITRRQTHFCI